MVKFFVLIYTFFHLIFFLILNSVLCPSALVLTVCGVVLDLHVLLRLPVRTPRSCAPAALSAVFLPSGSVIMRTTAATVRMKSVPPPVLRISSAAPVGPVYRWSSGVTVILTALTNQTRTSVPRPHQKPAVRPESSGVRADAVCRLIKSVTGGWIVDLLMILMNAVCLMNYKALHHQHDQNTPYLLSSG